MGKKDLFNQLSNLGIDVPPEINDLENPEQVNQLIEELKAQGEWPTSNFARRIVGVSSSGSEKLVALLEARLALLRKPDDPRPEK